MKSIKKAASAAVVLIGLVVGSGAQAQGIPVIDVASIAQQIQQVAAWAQQFQQMQQQFQQLQQSYNSMNGSRGMASLVNDPTLRQYLPPNYQSILNSGYGNSAAIRAGAQVYSIAQSGLDPNTDAARAFEANAQQAAINRATADEGYRQASQRFASIQVLLDKVNDAPDAKDIADLQARIQAEQLMMQNESIKLSMLAQLKQAQRDLGMQQAAEIRMKSTRGPLPPGW